MRILVVGAGLSGLSCALALTARGHDVSVLEASSRPGGRIGSIRRPDGFILDRGFQVLFSRYPSVRALIDLDALDLQPFDAGGIVRMAHGFVTVADPLRHPHDLTATLQAPFVTWRDAWAIARLSLDVGSLPDDHLLAPPPLETTDAYLRDFGFSDGFREHFLRPFFGGVFLHRDLANDARVFRFFWKMLAFGTTAVPKAGMQALPDQLAAKLGPDRLRYGVRVAALLQDGDRTVGVMTDAGETLPADAVVLAASYPEIRRLAGLTADYAGNAAITLYFDSPTSLTDSRKIYLNGLPDGLVNQVCQLDNVNPAYAPAGRHLIAVQVLGDDPRDDEALAAACLSEVAAWFPGHDTGAWTLLEAVRTPFGQFREEPAVMASLPRPALAPGLWMASELLVQSSIEGALRGGRLCAEAIARAPR